MMGKSEDVEYRISWLSWLCPRINGWLDGTRVDGDVRAQWVARRMKSLFDGFCDWTKLRMEECDSPDFKMLVRTYKRLNGLCRNSAEPKSVLPATALI